MKKKNISFEIFVIVILIVVSLIGFGIYLVVDLFNQSKSYVMFTNPYGILSCVKWDCQNVNNKLNDFNNKEYNIFIDGMNMGVNSLYYNNRDYKFYVFDKNNNNIYNEEKSLIAFSGKAKVNGVKFNVQTPSIEQINLVLRNSKIEAYSNSVGYSALISLDYDDDGKKEHLIILHDQGIPEGINKYYSILAYIDDDKVTILNEEESEDAYSIPHDFVFNIVDIFDDKKLEIINSRIFAEEKGICTIIYRLKGKKFVPVNECEIK